MFQIEPKFRISDIIVESEDYREFLEEHLPKGEWHRRILFSVVGYGSADGFCFEGLVRTWFSWWRQEKEGGEQALGRLPGVRNPNNFDPPFFFTCEKPVAMAAMGRCSDGVCV